MKFFRTLFIALLVSLSFNSCTITTDGPVSLVEGNKYETTYAKYVTTGGPQTITNEFDTKEGLEANSLYGTIEFKSGGIYWADDKEAGTWVEDGAYVIITEDGETINAKIEGNILKMTVFYESGSLTSTIDYHYTKM